MNFKQAKERVKKQPLLFGIIFILLIGIIYISFQGIISEQATITAQNQELCSFLKESGMSNNDIKNYIIKAKDVNVDASKCSLTYSTCSVTCPDDNVIPPPDEGVAPNNNQDS